MTDPIDSRDAALSPRAFPGRFEAQAKADAIAIEDAIKRAVAGVERWYETHFHRAALSGSAPITASDRAALVAHVSDSITRKE